MQGYEALQTIRVAAQTYEQTLDPTRRKQLGQFFSGIPLGKLLAHLSISPDTRTVLDPMAGHGDLLDAVREVAIERGITLEQIDGIEIDDLTATTCRNRLKAILGENDMPKSTILAANAFDLDTVNSLPRRNYDLVITNPPYVRYQRRIGDDNCPNSVRSQLKKIVESISPDNRGIVWNTLVKGYSGLADLSVPAWILAGFMVRPGGRLALVVPAAWRSRNYADIVRYLLLRCFALETIVADTQPGWFSDALIRTHLIIARRLTDEEVRQSVSQKNYWPIARWLHIAPAAANDRSLVGAAFLDEHPEAALVTWMNKGPTTKTPGIKVRNFDLHQEWTTLQSRISHHRWYPTVEGGNQNMPLFLAHSKYASTNLPDALRQVLPAGTHPTKLVTLDESGIKVGQGLRTGCNRFFYVTACSDSDGGMTLVKASPALGSRLFEAPPSSLRPVLRRQSEIALIAQGNLPPGRVLDLCTWILPEDARHVSNAKAAYELHGETPPRIMPTELATFVHYAASISLEGARDGRRIPELSAVRTNVRKPRDNRTTPRFWYMLPDFAPRHLPTVFVPRINQGTPQVECNIHPPLIIDANFSTFWALEDGWSPFAMKALLNSVWCRAYMETAGTPLGGGALKLEATHLKQMPVPQLTDDARAALHAAGEQLHQDMKDIQAQINYIVFQALFPRHTTETTLRELTAHIAVRTSELCAARQRRTS